MLHPAGTVMSERDLRFMDKNTLLHCIVVENGVGEEMIHLLDDFLKMCSFAGMKLNWLSLFTAGQFSRYRPPNRSPLGLSWLYACLDTGKMSIIAEMLGGLFD